MGRRTDRRPILLSSAENALKNMRVCEVFAGGGNKPVGTQQNFFFFPLSGFGGFYHFNNREGHADGARLRADIFNCVRVLADGYQIKTRSELVHQIALR